MRSFLLERGWRFLEVGDDVDIGRPMFDVSRTEPSDDSEDLEVCRLSEDDGRKSSNKLVLKLGMPQLQQYQLTSLASNASYTAVVHGIPIFYMHLSCRLNQYVIRKLK